MIMIHRNCSDMGMGMAQGGSRGFWEPLETVSLATLQPHCNAGPERQKSSKEYKKNFVVRTP
jgi:hypothetical protein